MIWTNEVIIKITGTTYIKFKTKKVIDTNANRGLPISQSSK